MTIKRAPRIRHGARNLKRRIMKVRYIIADALKILGRSALASSLEECKDFTDEEQETVQTLLFCYNAVEDELSRNGFELVTEEQLSSVSGMFYFNKFSAPVLKILNVKVGGAEVAYTLFPLYIRVNSPFLTVTYSYPPEKKELDGKSSYGEEIGVRVFSYGVLAEYFLINGETSASQMWEERYRAEISRLKLKLHGTCVAARRWV